ncbi:P-loop containing nucleoside triphosphate hydrolase protein [Pseudomassariella vexata]|uniref:p-loop containing nucleoside triphosphate hydrolase protein n=1 Tax=Pseudomassariella vexata TaxID=1141098 RepID=A0A1Y2DN92_9PEZI|nr:P-loop containing nucleoside triphosphate hydrolase protein [Pseudomassariella vexata]ORY60758.1 P-loop containing nucleoside triphosphate hydrolase protein [Pseudomassariella vexata]
MAIPQESVDAVLEHVFRHFQSQRSQHPSTDNKPQKPFILGLSGMQGSGKSTWAQSLANTLRTSHDLKVVVLSLDDLYHTHENLVKIREGNEGNELFRNRDQPGTHDELLAEKFFGEVLEGREFKVPRFEKSLFNGEGDRAPEAEWEVVVGQPAVDVLIFEGWCVGFQALDDDKLEEKWKAARQVKMNNISEEEKRTRMLRTHALEHVRVINENLRRYNETFMGPECFDYMVHLDTDALGNVYKWRIQQEEALSSARETGMSDEQVVDFVKVYMPAYELYLDRLRREAFPRPDSQKVSKTQLRVVLDERRRVVGAEEI